MINRNLILVLGTIALPLLSEAAPKTTKLKKASKDKPNVIFIYADDMGKGMLSAYGQKIIETPNMDRLINQGVQFSHAHGCHYSAPARASLITGYSDLHKGHWQKTGGNKYCVLDTTLIAPIEAKLNAETVRLPEGEHYLADVFNEAGYMTGQIGKIDYGFLSSREQVKEHGWQYFYGFLDHGRCHAFYPPFLFENDKIVMIEGNTRADSGVTTTDYHTTSSYLKRMDMTGKKQYSQDLFNDKIKDFLHQNKDNRFFLYHPTQLPHGPVAVPAIDPRVANDPGLTTLEKEYATMVLMLDDVVGMIIKEVEDLGLADKTMIILSSDNGHEIYYESHRLAEKSCDNRTKENFDNYLNVYRADAVGDTFRGTMDMAGDKRSNFQGGICVPLTYYFPSQLKPYTCGEVVSNYDLINTMADMLGVKISKEKEGTSYYPLLFDSTKRLPEDRFVLNDSYEGPTIIRNDGWKLRYCNVAEKYQLFNVRDDINETVDLATQYPDIVSELREILIDKVEVTTCRVKPYIDLKKKK